MRVFSKLIALAKKLTPLFDRESSGGPCEEAAGICAEMEALLHSSIDFEEVVDSLDDSVFITDGAGKVLYVNPAYERNTGITPEEVLGRTVEDIVNEGRLFTGGAIRDVLKNGKKAFRLSTTYKTNPPLVGYAVGVPIHGDDGKIKLVVASSRPILSLGSLQEDYARFLSEAKALTPGGTIRIIENEKDKPIHRLVTASPKLEKIWGIIKKAAHTDATVLVTGESGVGKEIVADEVYRCSKRADKPYIKINCASIPRDLLESELFGYDKGAFSGANNCGKPGLFEVANTGTLLLDEIGDMTIDLQAKLLRAIQSREITRIGGTKPISLDIRFIASTNSDLKKKISDGTFRSDLYYRLNVVPIHIPPLRERSEDINILCNHFIKMFSEKHGNTIKFTPKQIAMMAQYHWPGNVRELENVVEYLTICSAGASAVDDEMLKGILDILDMHPDSGTSSSIQEISDLNTQVSLYEKEIIERTLSVTRNLREAGNLLNVNPSTLSRKIKQYGIEYANTRESGRSIEG